MVKCNCGKTIENVPSWLNSVEVKFVCNNCPNRDLKSIAELKLEDPKPANASIDDDVEIDLDEEDEDEAGD